LNYKTVHNPIKYTYQGIENTLM